MGRRSMNVDAAVMGRYRSHEPRVFKVQAAVIPLKFTFTVPTLYI
jgi:hypothetical protein